MIMQQKKCGGAAPVFSFFILGLVVLLLYGRISNGLITQFSPRLAGQ